MIVTTEAIILKSAKYRDTSKLLTAYTEDFGRCSFVANGARKAKNKFGAALEPLACSRLTFYKHPAKDLHTLAGAETALPLRALLESFDKLTVGLGIAEAVYASQQHEERNSALYALLKAALQALNAAERNERTLLVWFQARLAEALGFALNPARDADSDALVRPEEAPEFALSLADGAPRKPSEPNAPQSQTGFRLEAGALAALQRLCSLGTERASAATALALSPRQQQQLEDFFTLYFQYHLDKRITERARRFLRDASP